MKRQLPNLLGTVVHEYFTDHLPRLRGISPHTIQSYRDCLVLIFFDRAIPAATAQKLGCSILTRTMEHRHQIGLDSYDRFFPNQDTLPKGGFGNLIALPLQRVPREAGNSVFVDADFKPYPDQ